LPLTTAQQALVTEHTWLVYVNAKAFVAGKPFVALPYEELVALGNMALVEAAGRHDPSRGISFPGYAWERIHGAMMNGIRHEKAIVTAARRALYRYMRVQEEEGNVFEDTAADWLRRAGGFADGMAAAMFLGLAGDVARTSSGDSETALEWREDYAQAMAALREAVSRLPEREQQLIRLHYLGGHSLKKVAEHLELTYITTLRLHAAILDRLALRLRVQDITTAPAWEP
jgi:RNA polymerase sigma factor for flagellar operon FliA